jgi:Ni/Fe-hydrogenase subunit HybB-like protein
MTILSDFAGFAAHGARQAVKGGKLYWAWVGLLLLMVGLGLWAYVHQMGRGLITTGMRDQVSWAFYIGNFTFLVGVAAAAVMLVVPAYVYHWKPIKEVVVLGELLAISAIVMCSLLVMADIGHPERAWHLMPIIGSLHIPSSLLAWDVVVLNLYLLLNLVIVTYLLLTMFRGRKPANRFFVPLVLFSIPAAIGIHTVTAFLYNGLAGRPFWNASILAPRFIASALCSGPAVLLILMQLLRRFTKFEIQNEAIWKVAELMAYAMGFNLFLLGAEVFKEYYSNTEHLKHMQYMFTGIEGHTAIVPFMWFAVAASIAAFVLFLIPATRRHPLTLNLGCVLIFAGVYIEKGMGLVIPGMTPDTLGEIYEYQPTLTEIGVTIGVFGVGGLVFTFLVKAAIPILLGTRKAGVPPPAPEADDEHAAHA